MERGQLEYAPNLGSVNGSECMAYEANHDKDKRRFFNLNTQVHLCLQVYQHYRIYMYFSMIEFIYIYKGYCLLCGVFTVIVNLPG